MELMRLLTLKGCPSFSVRCLHSNKDYYKSTYQREYLTPIKNREDLDKPLAKDDPFRFFPIKAPEHDGAPHLFRDELLDKLTNMIMIGGRKALARVILSKTLINIKHERMKLYLSTEDPEERAEIELDPVKIIKQAVANATPILHLVPYTRGGITYQVPTNVNPGYARFMALKWFVRMCRDRKVKGYMHDLLAAEFLAAYNKEGRVMQAKYDLHKICEANRAYAHYRST